ncbi:trigger factor [Roseomonas terrae]|uniref:Trigger factor n=1 Tax=Neoroseomonas terrae TaxID=424799 RepID=A0ABS5EJ14_9PROT|nr:trigger factor [Neoroseomonas terrae]
MQVTELANDGLKRAYSVTVSAADLAASRDKRLAEIAKTATMPGFRPGKVPMSVVKQRYGSAVLGEVLEQSVSDTSRQVITDRGLKPAMQPKVELTSFNEGADLEYRMDLEILPDVPMPDFSGIELERLKAEPAEEAIDKALASIAERNGELADAEPRAATKGDILVSDFTGRLPADLLKNGPGLGAVPGKPGSLPTGWAVETVGPLDHEIAAIGSEAGRPYFDLKVTGTPTEKAILRIRFAPVDELQVKGGDTLTLLTAVRVADGALPAGAEPKTGFNEISGDKDIHQRAAATLGADGDRMTLTLAEGDAPVQAWPSFVVTLPAGAVDFTLRVGPARVFAGSEEPEARVFPGGTATDLPIEVAGTGFIPGFTEQMDGMAPGETREIDVVFPGDYGSAQLAGKHARFSITAKALKTRVAKPIDDELAKAVGMADLAALKDAIRGSLQREYDALARLKLKRALLDSLADKASFPVPEGMVEAEFAQIWQRVEADLKAGRLDDDDKGKDEETLKAEYRGIAERRIRLGLLLSEIGRANNVQVGQDEMARAVQQEAMRYPGQEQQVLEFFRKNPQAAENLRAPLFEEKVVDFMIELAKVTERQVAPEELTTAAA